MCGEGKGAELCSELKYIVTGKFVKNRGIEYD